MAARITHGISISFQGNAGDLLWYRNCTRVPLPAHECYAGVLPLGLAQEGVPHPLQLTIQTGWSSRSKLPLLWFRDHTFAVFYYTAERPTTPQMFLNSQSKSNRTCLASTRIFVSHIRHTISRQYVVGYVGHMSANVWKFPEHSRIWRNSKLRAGSYLNYLIIPSHHQLTNLVGRWSCQDLMPSVRTCVGNRLFRCLCSRAVILVKLRGENCSSAPVQLPLLMKNTSRRGTLCRF